MATAAQLTANRANAQQSTGPQTADGKARVALNPLVHGLSRSKIFLPGETPEDFETTQAELARSFGCTTPAEASIVAQAALAFWKIRRVNEWQTEIIESALKGPDMPAVLARLFGETHEAALKILHRYEASAQSIYNRAITQLRLLKKEREGNAETRLRQQQAAAEAAFKDHLSQRLAARPTFSRPHNEANPISPSVASLAAPSTASETEIEEESAL